MAITQQQIAIEANVSRSTVAAILANRRAERFSEGVRNRVLETARKHGYRPNRYARAISNGKSGYIGILGFQTQSSLSFQKLKIAVEIFQQAKYDLLVQEGGWYQRTDGDTFDLLVQKMLDAQVEGALIVYPRAGFVQAHLNRLIHAGIPCVVIGGEGDFEGVPVLISDRPWGYQCITTHLLSLGYQRLGVLCGSPAMKSGVEAAIRAHDGKVEEPLFINPRDQYTPEMEKTPERIAYLMGYLGMQEVLSAKVRPEAVICANDVWAFGALRACAEHGVKVPEEMAITGYENDPAGEFGSVPLTTLDHPISEIGRQAAGILLNMIRTGKMPDEMPPSVRGKLIVRNSCGASLKKLI